MPNDEEVIQRVGSLRAMTGLTQQEFTVSLPHFEHAFLASMADRTMDGQPRMSRHYSTYATSPVPTMADKWLFFLTSVQQHPSQDAHGQLFGMSQSHANKGIHLRQAVLHQALAHQEWLPARNADELAVMLAAKRTEDVPVSPLVGMDGTERPIHRPKDPEDQQEYDRGKKKCHTRKHLPVITETCHMCFLSHTCEGKASDKSIAELAGYPLPPARGLDQDKGFQGFVLPGITIFQPKKTPRGGELTPPEQATNRRISSISIRIEHASGGVIRDRMMKANIRLLKDSIRDSMMEPCCSLHNFRLQYRPWHYTS